jgi:hypothetical protein
MAEINGDVSKTEVANGAGPPPVGRGLAGFVQSSMRSIQSAASSASMNVFQKPYVAFNAPFALTAKKLGELSNYERTHYSLGRVLDKASKNMPPMTPAEQGEFCTVEIQKLFKCIGTKEGQIDDKTLKSDVHAQDMELAANALATVILRSKPEEGITNDVANLKFGKEAFGTNAVPPKKLDSFLSLCWSAVQDFVLIMLIVLGIIGKLPRQFNLPPPSPPPPPNYSWLQFHCLYE